MVYLYDKSLADDLSKSFNPANVPNPAVSVIDVESAVAIKAQKDNDNIKFPAVILTRSQEVSIDTARMNFTRLHKGVQSVLDVKTNELYYEKSIPIHLNYSLTVLTTNTADMDEMLRELLFKYASMYFLTIKLPYECNRKVRFGVTIDLDKGIESKFGTSDYFQSGELHQSILPLRCEGCVLVTYTPAKLRRSEYVIEPVSKQGNLI